jgi:hypothetical protein
MQPALEVLYLVCFEFISQYLKELHCSILGQFLVLQILHAHPEYQVAVPLEECSYIYGVKFFPVGQDKLGIVPIRVWAFG